MTEHFTLTSLAEDAYGAYSASTKNKNFMGNPMPAWKELPASVKAAWRAAVTEVYRITMSGTLKEENA